MYRLLISFTALLVGVSSLTADTPPPFSDGFEGSAVNSYWTPITQYGNVSFSAEQQHSGSQSLRMTSEYGGQRRIGLSHTYATPTKGKITVWFYDAAPGQETLYEYLWLQNTTTNQIATMGTQDFDALCYTAQFYDDATQTAVGPNASCGVYPQTATTNVARTLGWHKLQIAVGDTSVTFSIDDVKIFSTQVNFSFDFVSLNTSGPYWRPNTISYFDDFTFEPPVPPYNICALYDQAKAVKSGSTVPVKVQICDATGANLSRSDLGLHALGLEYASSQADGALLQDAGNANPENDFRFDSALGNSGGYIYNLTTKGLAAGTYRVRMTIGGDSKVYSVTFQVK